MSIVCWGPVGKEIDGCKVGGEQEQAITHKYKMESHRDGLKPMSVPVASDIADRASWRS